MNNKANCGDDMRAYWKKFSRKSFSLKENKFIKEGDADVEIQIPISTLIKKRTHTFGSMKFCLKYRSTSSTTKRTTLYCR